MSNENNSEKKKVNFKELPAKAGAFFKELPSKTSTFFKELPGRVKSFNWKEWAKDNAFTLVAIASFLILLIVFSFLPQLLRNSRAKFWRLPVLEAYIEQSVVYLILALGACFVYLMGSMDISVGYQVGVFATIFVLIVNVTGNIFLALLTIVLLGLVCALFNAFVGAYIKLPTVMSAVILMQLFSGVITYMYSDSNISSMTITTSLSVLNSTAARIIAIILLIGLAFYLINYTVVGKRAKAVGSNKLAAQLAGADLLKTRMLAYGVFAIFLCVATLFAIARKDSFGESDTTSYQMDIMIMLLMGGMPLSGGYKGKVINAVFGTLTFVLITLGLSMCGVSSEYIFLVKSLIFVIIVCLTCRRPGVLLPR